jgi:hypothetical protein
LPTPGTTTRLPRSRPFTAACAQSSALIQTKSGVEAAASKPACWSVNSVFTGPGQSAVAVTPVPVKSLLSTSVKASTNAVEAEDVPWRGSGWKPAVEATFSTAPLPRSTIRGTYSPHGWTTASTFVWTIHSVTLRVMNRLGVAVLVILAFTLPACGGDDDGGGGTSANSPPSTAEEPPSAAEETNTTSEADGEERPPDRDEPDADGQEESERRAPTLTEYVRSADRICREAQSAIARRSAEYRKVAAALARGKIKPQEYYRRGGELTELSGAIAERAVADLKELPPPRSRREAVEAYLEGAAAQSEMLSAQGEALQQGRNKEVAKLNRRLAQASQGTRRAARRVGFRVCGGGT